MNNYLIASNFELFLRKYSCVFILLMTIVFHHTKTLAKSTINYLFGEVLLQLNLNKFLSLILNLMKYRMGKVTRRKNTDNLLETRRFQCSLTQELKNTKSPRALLEQNRR